MSQAQAPAAPPVPPAPPGSTPPKAPGPGSTDPELPRRFAKYTLIRKLATGGMAEIYLALQRSVAGFEKLIVVKRVLPTLAKDDAFIEMLLAEARIAATLNHPNVAHIYDVGVWEGEYYIAMEHIHGEDLRSLVRQMKKKELTSFPLEHALAIVLGCCKGLGYAHERTNLDGEPLDIVHRDVSPQNILVTFNGDVKLVDFGIAKAGRSAMEETRSGTLKGKIPYMSPEQARGLPVDGRSDVFSLGVILFELCTGKRLFRGKSEFETLKMIVEGEYPRPRSYNPQLEPRLEEIIVKALAKDRDHRYLTAREFQADLEAFIRDEQLAVSPISLGEWMQALFEDKLAQQKQMLQEGRQLAEVFATQFAEEESSGGPSHVRARAASKTPWILLLLVVIAAGGAGAFFYMRARSAAAARTGPGAIALTSEPAGAAVWVDGDPRPEHTPTTLEHLPLGVYTIKLSVDGHVPFTKRVSLTERTPHGALYATLPLPNAADFGVVRVRSTPPGAHVLFDGRDTGKHTPATIDRIAPGEEHSMALALDGYATKTIPLTMQAGQVQDLALSLTRTPLGPAEALLHIETVPADARVRLDDHWYDTGSPYDLRVAAQAHHLLVAASGFDRQERDLDLPGGKVTDQHVELGRSHHHPGHGGESHETTTSPAPAGGPGKLIFDARPWCNVKIDGTSVGQTPIVNRPLPSGPHHITCTNPELHVTRNVTLQIQAGQTTRQRINLQ